MKLTERQLRAVAIACGLLLVALGAAKGLVGLDLGERAERWITNGLFIVAALALVQLFRLRRTRNAARKP